MQEQRELRPLSPSFSMGCEYCGHTWISPVSELLTVTCPSCLSKEPKAKKPSSEKKNKKPSTKRSKKTK